MGSHATVDYGEFDAADEYAKVALLLLESMMLTMVERGVLTEDEVDEIFEDALCAYVAHDHGTGSGRRISHNAAAILRRLQAKGSVIGGAI